MTVVLPGLGLCASAVLLATLLHAEVHQLSVLVLAAAIGAIAANLGRMPTWSDAGVQVASKHLLRAGVVLLGCRIAVRDVLDLGARGLIVVLVVVAVTFLGTKRLGRALGVSPALSLLVAVGFSICGASAIAAVSGIAEAEEEEVTFAIALVTLCGSLAVLVLPFLGREVGLDGAGLGAWIGASVHDVAQVIATASAAGTDPAILKSAVVVKLTRIALLGPLIALLSTRPRDANRRTGEGRRRGPMLPGFVVGFLVAVAIRSTGIVPTQVFDHVQQVEGLLLAAGLFGLGTRARASQLRRLGVRPVVLGLLSWVLILVTAWAGVALVKPL